MRRFFSISARFQTVGTRLNLNILLKTNTKKMKALGDEDFVVTPLTNFNISSAFEIS